MFAKLAERAPTLQKKYFIFNLFLLVLEFIFYILIKNDVFLKIDKNIRENLKSSSLSTNYQIQLLQKIFFYFNNKFTPYIIIIIVDNFSNIYNTFILINTLSFIYYISAILKFIYHEINSISNNDNFFYCGFGFNLPSTEIITSIVIYFALFKLFISNKNSNNYNKIKYAKLKTITKIFIFIIIIVINVINIFTVILNGYYFFSHVLFSVILGIAIFLLLFEINIIDLNNGKKFIKFLKNYFGKFALFNIFLLIISFIPYIIERKIFFEALACNSNYKNDFFYYFQNNNQIYKAYIDGSFCLISFFFANFFLSLGYKFELSYLFQNDAKIYYQFYYAIVFDENNLFSNDSSNSGTIMLTNETQWNNTSFIKSFLRLIVNFVLASVCCIPYFIINQAEKKFQVVFFVKYFFPLVLITSGIGFWFKLILKKLHLTNAALINILKDK